MAPVDREFAQLVAWLIQWRAMVAQHIADGVLTTQQADTIDKATTLEIDRLRRLRRRRIEEVVP
jgi:hypothetical protein